ncbi:unnamed protein product [Camellia sinensis]
MGSSANISDIRLVPRMCNCGRTVAIYIVRTNENGNEGRLFFVCPSKYSNTPIHHCNYFKFVSEDDEDVTSRIHSNSTDSAGITIEDLNDVRMRLHYMENDYGRRLQMMENNIKKMANYDLCTECFNNGKLDSGWSPTDFILMEPAEAAGVSGGKWTDQETLLLLEALELYNENWNEVAEHVATKTKAQCILHFVQMPIDDSFMDCDDGKDASVKENADTAMADNDSSAPKETLEILESRTGTDENQPQSSPMEIPKPKDASELKADQKSTSVFQNHFQNIRTILEHADPFQDITTSFTTCRSISEPVSSVAYQFQHQNQFQNQ